MAKEKSGKSDILIGKTRKSHAEAEVLNQSKQQIRSKGKERKGALYSTMRCKE